MSKYSELSEKELKNLTDLDETEALYETGLRAKKKNNLKEARKFFTFAAQLGHSKANIEIGEFYEEEGILEKACEHYKAALLSGDDSIAVKLASLLMDTDPNGALDVLISSAVQGNQESINMLEKYYSENGDESEASYWKGQRNGK